MEPLDVPITLQVPLAPDDQRALAELMSRYGTPSAAEAVRRAIHEQRRSVALLDDLLEGSQARRAIARARPDDQPPAGPS